MEKSSIALIHGMVCGVFLSVSCLASAAEIACPARISMRPAVVTGAPAGWQVSQRSTSPVVQGALITVGPPEDHVDLKPDIETVKGVRSFIWKFDPAESSKGHWLSCGYGVPLVLLSQKLPAGISQCHAREPSVDAKGTPVMSVSCQ